MSMTDIPKPNFEIKTSEEIRNDRNQNNEKRWISENSIKQWMKEMEEHIQLHEQTSANFGGGVEK